MEPKYKVNPLTGELQEYIFEYNGILALRNFTAKVEDERLILHAADDVNFSILEALVSEVEINGVVYDNPTAAQEALTRLTFNQNRPVLLDKTLKDLILGAVQKVEGKGLSSNDFTNAYKQQLDALEDYDIELDESTTELKFKKGNNVLKRISLMFLDDEGTKLVYNKVNKNLELRDKRDNLLTSIPVSHFVSNIPTSIVVQNGKIKLMSGDEVIGENTISYNDLADKPELNYLPLNGGTVTGDVSLNGDLLIKDKTKIYVRDNGNIAFGNKPFNDLVIGEFKGIQLWGQGNDKVVLAGGEVTNLSELKNENVKVGGRNYILNSQGNFKQYTTFNISEDFKKQLSEHDKIIMSADISYKNAKTGGRLGIEFSITYEDNTKQFFNVWKNVETSDIGKSFSSRVSNVINHVNKGKNILSIEPVGLHIQFTNDEAIISNIKLELGNTPTDWSPATEDLGFSHVYDILASSLNDNVNRETGVYSVLNQGVGTYMLISFRGAGSTSQLEIFKPNWFHETRLQVRNRIDNNRYSGNFKDLAWYDDVLRAGVECTQDTTLQKEHQNQTIFVTVSCNIELNTIDDLSSVSFRKVFDNGVVSFSCNGKNIIYTADNQFNGKKGSTAVVSIYDNDCYIDIRNI